MRDLFIRLGQWVTGWRETLRIKYFEPELYKVLTGPIDMDDFDEVPDPLTAAARARADEPYVWGGLNDPIRTDPLDFTFLIDLPTDRKG